MKPPPQQQPEAANKPPAALLPTLHLGGGEQSCTLDFGQVALSQSKALPFAIVAPGGGGGGSSSSGGHRLEVERQPLNVQVRTTMRQSVSISEFS